MATEREGLGLKLRIAYGVGLSAEGIKTNAFNLFLLFYYQQVAGLAPVLCGVGLFVALCVDAVVDPAIGVWSDGLRSRLGRRHPFMYASSVPLALAFWAVFNPPPGLGQTGLFAWLLASCVASRVAMSLFVIPHQALVPELSDDYDERTRLQSARTVFAWLFGLVNALLAYTVFLRATDTLPYDPAGFSGFATWGAIAMFVAILVSARGTQRVAIAKQPRVVERVPLRELVPQIRTAFDSSRYRVLVGAGLVGAVAFGLGENVSNYMNLFFWGFSSQELAAFIFVIMGASLVAWPLAPRLALRFGKHRIAIACAATTTVLTPLLVGMRFLDVLPAAGTSALLALLCVSTFVGYGATIVGMVMFGAMMADVTDEHELRTGARQEGLLFAASMLVAQAASGLGPLIAGVVLELAGLSSAANGASFDPTAVGRMGVLVAAFGAALGLVGIWLYSRYTLTREVHDGIVAALRAQRHEPIDSARVRAAGNASHDLTPHPPVARRAEVTS